MIRAELGGADRLRDLVYDVGRWGAARSYNLALSTPAAQWRDEAMEFRNLGWPLSSRSPRRIGPASPRFLQRCAKEGVVSIVGDDATAQKALNESWP